MVRIAPLRAIIDRFRPVMIIIPTLEKKDTQFAADFPQNRSALSQAFKKFLHNYIQELIQTSSPVRQPTISPIKRAKRVKTKKASRISSELTVFWLLKSSFLYFCGKIIKDFLIHQSFHSADAEDRSNNVDNFMNSWADAENSMNNILG